MALLFVGTGPAEMFEPVRRCFGTALPGCDLLPFVAPDRATLVARCFAEARADIFVVADTVADPLAVAWAVAAIAAGEAELVLVDGALASVPESPGGRLVAAALGYLFGCGTGALSAGTVACSRRVASDYVGDGGTLDLALHALRRRMPVREIAALGAPPAAAAPPAPRSSWSSAARAEIACLLLVGRLFAEERPRRTFGLGGIGLVAAGVAAALPWIRIHDWSVTLPGAASVLSLALVAAGVGAGFAGLLLDTMVQARQDVTRISHGSMMNDPAAAADAVEPRRARA